MNVHILQHIAPKHRDLLHLLVEPMTQVAIGAALGWTTRQVDTRIIGITESLGIERTGHGEWRVALVRMYYGIDSCWCEA